MATRNLLTRLTLLGGALAAAALATVPGRADAFCGFYVASADSKLYNHATVVVLMRDGVRTALAMQNNYQGPPERFAMVVPVPVVLRQQDVKTLPRELFDRVDQLGAPRLVEYWEQDPCDPNAHGLLDARGGGGTGPGYGGGGPGFGGGKMVKIEAEFAVGEYDIVILSAEDALALEQWLTENGYVIPAGASKHLQPYVAAGMKFFVARVDPTRLTFDAKGMATLSPLRVNYESDQFSLPIRLGLINAAGPQDLIVNILAAGQRYEVANHPNVTLPTELLVQPAARDQFPAFYAALFDGLMARTPDAVVTEYAWDARSCDPCPGEPLTSKELASLGMDVLFDGLDGVPIPQVRQGAIEVKGPLDRDIVRRIIRAHINELRYCYNKMLAVDSGAQANFTIDFTVNPAGKVERASYEGPPKSGLDTCATDAFKRWTFPKPGAATTVRAPFALLQGDVAGQRSFVLTRLHARYDAATLGEDLVFRAAPPIRNGSNGPYGPFVQSPVASDTNRFQGRFIVRHPWPGALKCEAPTRERWGGPPEGKPPQPQTVTDAAFAPRGAIDLSTLIAAPIEALAAAAPEPVPKDSPSAEPAPSAAPTPTSPGGATHGCGCRDAAPATATAGLLVGLLALTRRRRSARGSARGPA